jgi:hypothetical protein
MVDISYNMHALSRLAVRVPQRSKGNFFLLEPLAAKLPAECLAWNLFTNCANLETIRSFDTVDAE